MRYGLRVRVLSLLLLAFLGISLIANVAEAAQACVNMHFGGAGAQPVANAGSLRSASLPCHELPTTAPASLSQVETGQGAPSADGELCCDEDACRWACGQHSAAEASLFSQSHQAATVLLAVKVPQHRPPHLPHLIRPPIG